MENNTYKSIIKATSILGGVQVFGILVGLIRSKFVAVWLGADGLGIMALLTSTTTLIATIANLGLATSAIRNISQAQSEPDKLQRLLSVFRTIILTTAILGALFTLTASKWLSQISFGNSDYTYALMALSVSVLFTQLAQGRNIIFQGLQRVNYLAKSSMFGSFIGLVVGLPLYYFFREKAIVPNLIIISVFSFILSEFFYRTLKLGSVRLSFKDVWNEGREMIKLGLLISTASILTNFSAYITRVFIGKEGGLGEVGFYSAGFTIISTYFGLIFTAMGTDYYPRLSKVAQDPKQLSAIVCQQTEVMLLLFLPLIVGFIGFVNPAIRILLSKEFLNIGIMLQLAIPGVLFQGLSWALAFIILANGHSKRYFYNELTAIIYLLAFNILGYYLAGLKGIGIAFCIGYVTYFIQQLLINGKYYTFRYNAKTKKLIVVVFVIIAVSGGINYVFVPDTWIKYLLNSILLMIALIISLRALESRIQLVSMIKSKMRSYK